MTRTLPWRPQCSMGHSGRAIYDHEAMIRWETWFSSLYLLTSTNCFSRCHVFHATEYDSSSIEMPDANAAIHCAVTVNETFAEMR